MRFEVIELENGKYGLYDNETGYIMVSKNSNLLKSDLEKSAERLNHLCKFMK